MKTRKLIEVVLIALVTISGGSFPMIIIASVLGYDNLSASLGIVFTTAFLLVCIIGAINESNQIIKIKEERRAR